MFKQSEIKPCAFCKQGILHSASPLFYRVKVEQMVLDMQAIRRQAGLEMMMGSAAGLAAIMGPNEDMAKSFGDAQNILICNECALSNPDMLMAFVGEEE
jgi:ABC-type uncharacterized transport system permease subunit